MVKVICEKTGLEFEAVSKRTKNHPQIMDLLQEANRNGWYRAALEALKTGREQGFTTVEEFINAARKAGQSATAERHAQIEERNEIERQYKAQRQDRHVTNNLLRGRGYHWRRFENDEEDQDFFGAPVVEYTLYSPDNRVVPSVKEAMLELAWQGVNFAKEWLAEHGVAEEMPAIEKQRQAEQEAQAKEDQEVNERSEEKQRYQQEAEAALIEAGFDPQTARYQATRWNQPHLPGEDFVTLSSPVRLRDLREVIPVMNGDLRYGVLIDDDWYGINEVLEIDMPETFRKQLELYAERNKRHGN